MSEIFFWPKQLRVPQREGYSYSPLDRRAKSEMEIGGRYRVIFDTDETTLNCNFLLHISQVQFFEAFEKHLLSQGSVWFRMPLLTAGQIQEHTVRMKERPKFSDFRDKWCNVSLVLDLAQRETWDSVSTFAVYYWGSATDFIYFEDALNKTMNVDYPIALPHSQEI